MCRAPCAAAASRRGAPRSSPGGGEAPYSRGSQNRPGRRPVSSVGARPDLAGVWPRRRSLTAANPGPAQADWLRGVVMAKPFSGTINVDVTQSVPDWGPYTQPIAPEGTPSVLYIVLDDVGYSAMGAYGGLIETPNIDRIAHRGLT